MKLKKSILFFAVLLAVGCLSGCSPSARPRATEEYKPSPEDFRHIPTL